MAISLRFVFAASTALIVLIVAATTLAITLTVSLSAVQNTGQSLALAIASTVKAQVENYNGKAEDQVWDFSDRVRRPEFLLPTNDTDSTWWNKWIIPLDVDVAAVNYDYNTISALTDDGGMVSVIPVQDVVGMVVADPRTLAKTGQCTFQLWAYNITTMLPYPIPANSAWPFNLTGNRGDQRVPGYFSFLQFAGPKRACLWFAPTLDVSYSPPQFILYGSCTLRNASNSLLGIMAFGRHLSGIGAYLGTTSKTPNTQLFVIDNYNLVVATTHSAPFQTFYQPSQKSITSECVSSKDSAPTLPEIIGCRTFAANSPYAPLADVASSDSDFVTQSGTDARFGTLAGDAYYYISLRIKSRLGAYTMNLLLFMPQSDVLGDIVQGRNIAIIVTAVVFLLAAGLTTVMTGILMKPLDEVARRMYQTAQLDEDDAASYGDVISVISTTGDGTYSNFVHQEAEPVLVLQDSSLTEIKALQVAYTTLDTAIKSFTRYVPRDVVKELMARNELCEIAMRPMRCSMLFTDIAGFTSICERVPPPALSKLVRVFFQRASREVMAHGGVIDKFIGDCVMAVWGAPIPVDHAELRVALCARMLVHESQSDPLRSTFTAVGETLSIRVGAASGEVLAGNMGSEARMSYTVIGDDVNLASRLEALNKQWGTNVLIAQSTAEECYDLLVTRLVVQVAVLGKAEPVRVYEVLGVRRDAKVQDLGTSAADASENITVTQAKYDAQRRELDEKYGTKKPIDDARATTGGIATAATLLRRCRAKVPVAHEEMLFAELYEKAMNEFIAARFNQCLNILLSMSTRPDVPKDSARRLSVVKVIQECERFIAAPPGAAFTGVWVAAEK